MTATTSPLIRFEPDQATVPPATRERDLLALAEPIAKATKPTQPVELTKYDMVAFVNALPNLPDDDICHRLTGIIAELHQVELAGRIEERDPEYRHPDDYTESAAQLARDAVAADIAAGAR